MQATDTTTSADAETRAMIDAGPGHAPAEPARTVAVRPSTVARMTTQPGLTPEQLGPLLWDLLRKYLRFYVAFRKPSDADLVAAWVIHACARNRGDKGMGQLIWRATPRLLIISRKRGAGKSTLLDLIVFLTGSRRGKVPRLTPARLAQITGQAYETVCIDEGRLIFGAGARHEDLQACLLAGYTPMASYEVSKTSLSLFGSVVIATKESLITEASKAVDGDESSLGDLLDRCLKVILAAPKIPMPEVGEQAQEDGELLGRVLIAWTDAMRQELRGAARDIADEDLDTARSRAQDSTREPENLRAAQIARPLRAAGRVIGPGAERDILAALQGADESSEIMTELQGRPWASDGDSGEGGEAEDWGDGHIVYAAERDDEALAALAASLPPAGPQAPAATVLPPAAVTAPAATWTAAWAVAEPGEKPEIHELPGPWGSSGQAKAACQATAPVPLSWHEGRTPGMWVATIPAGEGGPEVSYAITSTQNTQR